jgi:hypothetical protein
MYGYDYEDGYWGVPLKEEIVPIRQERPVLMAMESG